MSEICNMCGGYYIIGPRPSRAEGVCDGCLAFMNQVVARAKQLAGDDFDFSQHMARALSELGPPPWL